MTNPDTRDGAVRNLQRYLRRLSYEDKDIPPVPIDGIFDSATEDALLAFQRAYGLPQTGRADRETWERLFSEYERLSAEKDLTERVDLFPKSPQNYETALGEESAFVLVVQYLLSERALIYDAFGEIPQSGRYDEATAAAVAELQRAHSLPATGLVNRATWNRLIRDFTLFAT